MVMRALLSEDAKEVEESFSRLGHCETLINKYSGKNGLINYFFGAFVSDEKESEEDSINLFFHQSLLGEITLYKAGLHFRGGSIVKGAYFLRKSWKIFESISSKFEKLPEFIKKDQHLR